MIYQKLICIIEKYIDTNISKEVSQVFCDEYMDVFYAVQNDLEQEVTQDIYELFDDLNLVCDSYEPNVEIREMDTYCIDELSLMSKVTKIYKQLIK